MSIKGEHFLSELMPRHILRESNNQFLLITCKGVGKYRVPNKTTSLVGHPHSLVPTGPNFDWPHYKIAWKMASGQLFVVWKYLTVFMPLFQLKDKLRSKEQDNQELLVSEV